MLFGEFVFCASGHAWVSIKGDSAHSLINPCRGLAAYLLTLSKRLEKHKKISRCPFSKAQAVWITKIMTALYFSFSNHNERETVPPFFKPEFVQLLRVENIQPG